MPLDSSLVGHTSSSVPSSIDNRWAMNYAAGVDDFAPVLYDTTQEQLPVHPMYLGSVEWEAAKLVGAALQLKPEEKGRGVQVTHDIRLHRPLRPGMELVTRAEVVGIHRHRAGAFLTLKLDTHTESGDPVATTHMGSIYRDVDVAGDDRPPADAEVPEPADEVPSRELELAVPANACHVYSECARIYNAFHTDISVAKEFGLKGLILHGTGTIARAVSAITNELTDGDPSGIRRIHAGLKGMVMVPTALTVNFRTQEIDGLPARVHFTATTPDAGRAITDGLIDFAH